MPDQLVTTRSRRFVHRREHGHSNTVCGAVPNYYGPGHLTVVTDAETFDMHKCKKCFPLPQKDPLLQNLQPPK